MYKLYRDTGRKMHFMDPFSINNKQVNVDPLFLLLPYFSPTFPYFLCYVVIFFLRFSLVFIDVCINKLKFRGVKIEKQFPQDAYLIKEIIVVKQSRRFFF